MSFENILFFLILVMSTVWFTRFFLPASVKNNKWLKEILSFLPILILVFSFRSFAFEPFRIPSGSMKPVFLEGDFIWIDKFSHGIRLPVTGTRLNKTQPKRGDIVVFKGEVKGKPALIIKRIIGLPGDNVEYKNKRIIINGQMLEKTFVKSESDSGEDQIAHINQPHLNPIKNKQFQAIRYHETLDNHEYDIYNYPYVPETTAYPYENVIVPKNMYFVMGNNRDNSNDSRYWGFLSDDNIVGKARAIWFSINPETYQPRWNRIGIVS